MRKHMQLVCEYASLFITISRFVFNRTPVVAVVFAAVSLCTCFASEVRHVCAYIQMWLTAQKQN